MEPKRELTSADLAALVTELGAYEGAKLDKAYLYGDDLLRLKLRDFDRGRVELLIEVGERKRASVLAAENVPDAPERPPNFAKMLRNRLTGADFAGVTQFEFDRILVFEFERGGERTQIVAELFGDGNIAVLDENGRVIDCLDTVRLKSRTVAPGSHYEFPAQRFNPLTVDFEGFAARMDESDTDVVRTLATQLNFGGRYAEELCTRAGVEKTLDITEADDSTYRALHGAVSRLADRLSTGDLDPRVYTDDEDRTVDVTPITLEEHADLDGQPHDTFLDAIETYFLAIEAEADAGVEGGGSASGSGGGASGGRGRGRSDLEEQLERQRRIVEQQENAIEEFDDQAENERAKAESLYAHYDLADEIITTVRDARERGTGWKEIEKRFEEGTEQGIAAAEAVRGLDPEGGVVRVAIDGRTVELDPREGVEQNADSHYHEAKRVLGKKEGAMEALENSRAELDALEDRIEAWEAGEAGGSGPAGGAGDAGEEGDSEDDEPTDWLADPSIPVRATEQWYEAFRWFHTSDDFLVIGGRDADDNEALVKKYLDRGDRFFHTQARGGPVTILKATGPSEPAPDGDLEIPERSLQQAAQFAVSYASVWKDGRFAGDAYMVDSDQVSKTPESGEYLEKGGFAIRGDRTYFEDTPVGVAVGITCEPETRVIGGPPESIRERAVTAIEVEPGRYAQNDTAKRLYREFRGHFADETFVRKVASPDLIAEFLPPGGSRIVEE